MKPGRGQQTFRDACTYELTYRVRRVVQSHIDVTLIDVVVGIGILVLGIIGFFDGWE